jgi:hypothetical protein
MRLEKYPKSNPFLRSEDSLGVCVCVREREREREWVSESERGLIFFFDYGVPIGSQHIFEVPMMFPMMFVVSLGHPIIFAQKLKFHNL